MQNNQNPPVSKCELHCFSLRPTHKDRRPNLNATVTMCRSKQTKNKKNTSKCGCYQGPLFNRDRCYATPAFIPPSEKTEYAASTRAFLRDHEKKVKQYEEQADDLFVPKPRSKSLYCNVCREPYQEYLEHIKSTAHRTNIKSCLFNHHILDLQKKFRNAEQKELSIFASSETGSPTIGEDEVEEIGAKGRKKVKTSSFTENNAAALPNPETNQNYTPTGPTQNMFYSTSSFPHPFDMMGRLNECRDFYSHCNTMAFNPYFSYLSQNSLAVGYPMYCIPYQPMINLQIFQQNH